MALHIEVDAEENKKASRGLSRLYGSASDKFPLGIQMHLVSEFRAVKGNPIMMGKHMCLRLRQSSFCPLMVGHPSDDIMMLDYHVEGKTLRQLVIWIQSYNPGTL